MFLSGFRTHAGVLICNNWILMLKFKRCLHTFCTGSALIASLQMNRSTVAVENSPTQFLYGKLRAVSVLSIAGGEEGDNLPD